MSATSPTRVYAAARSDNFVFSPVRGRRRAKSFELVPEGQAGISMGMNVPLPARTIRIHLKEIELCAWIGQARPGDVLEYHRGFLALDVMRHGSRLSERDRAELARVGRRALWAAEQDFVHLVQRRHGPDDYSYLAIARPRPRSAPVSLSALVLAEAA